MNESELVFSGSFADQRALSSTFPHSQLFRESAQENAPGIDAIALPRQGAAAFHAEDPRPRGPAFLAANLALKRALDIVVAASALVVLLPLFAWIMFRIRRESPGAPIFSQLRWGRGMRQIRVYKFRTMYADRSDATGVRQTVVNDGRVTRFGSLLRRTNLDELPQLYNVLRGDMSLVGPRCHPVGMRAGGMLYEDLVAEYHQRHVVRPGITGLAQVRGYRGPTVHAQAAIKRVQYDLAYVRGFSVWLDLKIVVATLLKECRAGSGF